MSNRSHESHLIIGNLGEIGTALSNLLKLIPTQVYGIDLRKINENIIGRKPRDLRTISFDYIHICIPYSDSFNKIVTDYITKYGENHTIVIIHSTVYPTTTALLINALHPIRFVYSPIRAVHPYIKEGLVKWIKYIASTDENALLEVSWLFQAMKLKTKISYNPTALEFAKHFSTLMYGYSLAFTQHLAIISKKYNFNPSLIHDFINEVGEQAHDRKIYPYIESIGGHCVLPNAKMILDISNFAKLLLEFNETYKNEIGSRMDIKK